MLLKGADLETHIEEIHDLYTEYLEVVPKGVAYFGTVNNGELQAVSALKCYCGHWYLRSCVVKPELRGQGMQRELIRERLEYLADRTDNVRVAIFPDNEHSIRNVLAEGFEFEKFKKLEEGKVLNVYKYVF